MLIEAKFLSKGKTFYRVFNPNNVIYIDEQGVLFSDGVHALFEDGEYVKVIRLLQHKGGEEGFYTTGEY